MLLFFLFFLQMYDPSREAHVFCSLRSLSSKKSSSAPSHVHTVTGPTQKSSLLAGYKIKVSCTHYKWRPKRYELWTMLFLDIYYTFMSEACRVVTFEEYPRNQQVVFPFVQDMNREVVKSDSASTRIPQLDFEIPPFTQKGCKLFISLLTSN